MGKKRHTQDKLHITYKELVQDWGGKNEDSGIKSQPLKKLPFYCCSLSFMPFKDPVCLQDGTIFDLINILPYIKKFKKNPITGLPIKPSDLTKLNFYKNPEGEYHCPITYKSFSDNSTIIVVKETGNVYSYEAYDELNKKPKNFKDLLTNQPFDPKNVIMIQDPKNLEEKNVNNFDFIKRKEDIDFLRHGEEDFLNKKENFVNLPSSYMNIIDNYEENASEEQLKRVQVLNMINNRQNIEEEDERMKKIGLEYLEFKKNFEGLENEILYSNVKNLDSIQNLQLIKKIFRISTNCYIYYLKKTNSPLITHERFTDGKASGSFTSTSLNANYKNKMKILSDDEIRIKTVYPKIKSEGLKGFVRMNTNFGFLNLMIHCDLAPKTSENFLELCESGFYNNVVFHRMVKNFVLQGGDPTGTGTGGSCIFGKYFDDEFSTKLLHKERGIMSMANSGKHTNSSQFFIILKPTPHLDNRHAVFGEVVGNIKVLDDIEAVGNDKKGTPNKEIKILSVEVFKNPFRDVICNMLIKEFNEKFMNEKEKLESEKIKKVDEEMKRLDSLESKNIINDKNGDGSMLVGKYLNKKRGNEINQDLIFNSNRNNINDNADPYAYDKPKNKDKKRNFDFSGW